MPRAALRVQVSKKDQVALKKLLRGGIEQVRVVLRAVALSQLAQGNSAPQIAEVLPLTRQAVRNLARRYQQGGLERALYDKQRPGAARLLSARQRQRIIAMVCADPPPGRARWTVRRVAAEAVTGAGSRAWAEKPSASCCCAMTSSRGGKKMWCGPQLHDDDMALMEDVLATYERPPDPKQPVVCFDEKAVTLHADVRAATPAAPGRPARRDSE